MADEKAGKGGLDDIEIEMRRAGIKGGPGWAETFAAARADIEKSARAVREGLERPDEPSTAFHVPRVKKP